MAAEPYGITPRPRSPQGTSARAPTRTVPCSCTQAPAAERPAHPCVHALASPISSSFGARAQAQRPPEPGRQAGRDRRRSRRRWRRGGDDFSLPPPPPRRSCTQSLSPSGSGPPSSSAASGGTGGTARAATAGMRLLTAADVVGRDAIPKSLHSLCALCVTHGVVCSCTGSQCHIKSEPHASEKRITLERIPRRYNTIQRVTDTSLSDRRRCCKRRFITTSLAGIDTSALTHRLMQRCRSVKHPGRSGSGWGTRVSAFQSCTCSVQRLEQCGRRSRRDHSRQSDIDFDVGLPDAVRAGPAATSSHRFACIYDATRGTATRTARTPTVPQKSFGSVGKLRPLAWSTNRATRGFGTHCGREAKVSWCA